MKTWKLVSGILSIIFAVFVAAQSAIIYAHDLISGGSSGVMGLFVSVFMLSAGIVSIVTRKGKSVESMATIILYFVASLIAFPSSQSHYADLAVWGAWAMICAVSLLLGILLQPKTRESISHSLLSKTFLSGCACVGFLSAVYSTFFPIIIYIIAYVIVSCVRSDKGAQEEAFRPSNIPCSQREGTWQEIELIGINAGITFFATDALIKTVGVIVYLLDCIF